MPVVTLKEGERFDNLLRRFRKAVDKSGIMSELRKREHYEKPSVKKKRKQIAAIKRNIRQSRQVFLEDKD